ncbi:MAG TPA: ABC transporter ATP-binding protein, partial [Chitinophagaceae bacterium]|nr:ABC transporter ATP-binding protein [Chitinophagaceae bacterium]
THAQDGSLAGTLARGLRQLMGRRASASPTKDVLWALRDVSFEIKKGEVFGIIGTNGSGKSTLLKILSRVTEPTKGRAVINGRFCGLLEVGTGFHPELTGRDNVYMSGAILGMKRQEIARKFDEIVAFAEVEQFIDTPVKHYSSGMYVRLGFSVLAHMDPEILIVDEVLAVGDVRFQKKCMGKMKDVSTQKGRTIIFVSHNMQAVTSLCSKAIWLQKGAVLANGEAKTVVNNYMSHLQRRLWKQEWPATEAPGNDTIKVLSVELAPQLPDALAPVDIRTPLTVTFRFYNSEKGINLMTGLHLFTVAGECIFDVATAPAEYDEGIIEGTCTIPGNFLNDGSYYFSIIFVKDSSQELFYLEECLYFDVDDYREGLNWYGKWMGYVRPQFPFALTPVQPTAV